jgi:hypothetical protein
MDFFRRKTTSSSGCLTGSIDLPPLSSLSSSSSHQTVPESAFNASHVFRAYLLLPFVSPGPRGDRLVLLARVNRHEIRLIKFPFGDSLWLELFSNDLQTGIDSGSCSTFSEAVSMAEQFIQIAQDLDEQL